MRRSICVIVFLLSMSTVFGLILPDGTSVEGEQTAAYKSGKPQKVTLLKPAAVSTPAGRLEFRDELTFYENGILAAGRLSRDQDIDTPLGRYKFTGLVPYEPEVQYTVGFHPNGAFRNGTFAKPSEIKTPAGKVIAGEFSLYQNGGFQYCSMNNPQSIVTPFGNPLVTSFSFFSNGKLQSFVLAEHHTIKTPLGDMAVNYNVVFHADGALKEISNTDSWDVMTPAGIIRLSGLQFYPSGKIRFGVCSKDVKVKGKKFLEGDLIMFSEKGKVLGKGYWNSAKQDQDVKR